jgi:hypothetical protein
VPDDHALELLRAADVGDLPPVADPRLVCECNNDDCRVLATVDSSEGQIVLRFSGPTDHFVVEPESLAHDPLAAQRRTDPRL